MRANGNFSVVTLWIAAALGVIVMVSSYLLSVWFRKSN